MRLKNPSSKPLTYYSMVAGRDARDFVLPRGNTIVIPPKATLNIGVEFKSRCASVIGISRLVVELDSNA